MDISFTGINNLYIGKKAYSKFGTYLGEDRKLKQGKKFYTEIKMKCNLTNDAQGNDLEDFQVQTPYKDYYQIFGHSWGGRTEPLITDKYAMLDCCKPFILDTEIKELKEWKSDS